MNRIIWREETWTKPKENIIGLVYLIYFRIAQFCVLDEGKIIILERFCCSLTKIIQLNCKLVKLIGKIEICSLLANFCKLAPGPLGKWAKNVHFSDNLHNIPKQVRWPLIFSDHFIGINDLRSLKTLKIIYRPKLEIYWSNRLLLTQWKHASMITLLCPFLLESQRLNLKLLCKLGINARLII